MISKKDDIFSEGFGERKIDEIKAHLYSRKTGKIKFKRKKLKKEKVDFKNSWGEGDVKRDLESNDLSKFQKKGPSVFSIFFVIALIFFVGAVSFASFLFLFNKNEVKSEIEMSIVGPNSIKSGEVLEFLVNLENPTDLDYKDVEFVISYPDSTLDAVEKVFVKHKTVKHSEDLVSGGKIGKKFSAILSGIRDEKKEIKITVSYKAGGFSNLLFLNRIYNVKIESSPVTVEMGYPKEVLSKKDFSFDVNILSNNSEILKDLIIIGNYPSGFILSDTNPKPVFSNETQSIFKIDELKAGEKKNINIKGSLTGQNNEEKFFSFALGDTVPFRNEIRTLFSEIEKVISIKRPDIDLIITSNFDNNDGEVIVPAGKRINFDISLANNLSSLMSDLKITTNFSDDLITEREVIAPKGFFNSTEDSIVWDKNTDRFLKSLSQNESVKEIFSLKVKDLNQIAGYFKDPKIILDFGVEGTNFNDENSGGYMKEKFKKVIKIPTNVYLETDIFYERGPFENVGSIQPKVGEATTYTVAWKIFNSSSDIFDVEVSAKLPPYVNYINNVSPKNAYISYDKDKREVTLKFKKIDAFIGYRTDPKSVYFQVELVPTAPQIGKKPTVVGEKMVKASDRFTNREIEIKVDEKTTAVKNDSISGFEVGTVRE